MTNATTKIATISETNRKVLKSHSVDSVVSRYIHLPDAENFKPSDCKVGLDLAKTGLGMVFTADSFTQGLVSLGAMHAWGQKTHAQIVDKLPPLSVDAFNHMAGLLKRGSGCTSLQLRMAVTSALNYCIALPKREKAVKAIADKESLEGENIIDRTSVDFKVAPKSVLPYLQLVNSKLALKLSNERELAARNETARLTAEASVKTHDDAPDFVALFSTLFMANHDQGYETLAEMAKIAGYKLVKVSAKKAA